MFHYMTLSTLRGLPGLGRVTLTAQLGVLYTLPDHAGKPCHINQRLFRSRPAARRVDLVHRDEAFSCEVVDGPSLGREVLHDIKQAWAGEPTVAVSVPHHAQSLGRKPSACVNRLREPLP